MKGCRQHCTSMQGQTWISSGGLSTLSLVRKCESWHTNSRLAQVGLGVAKFTQDGLRNLEELLVVRYTWLSGAVSSCYLSLWQRSSAEGLSRHGVLKNPKTAKEPCRLEIVDWRGCPHRLPPASH